MRRATRQGLARFDWRTARATGDGIDHGLGGSDGLPRIRSARIRPIRSNPWSIHSIQAERPKIHLTLGRQVLELLIIEFDVNRLRWRWKSNTSGPNLVVQMNRRALPLKPYVLSLQDIKRSLSFLACHESSQILGESLAIALCEKNTIEIIVTRVRIRREQQV